MKKSSTRILTTHAGSLIRPGEIVEAMIQDHLRESQNQEKFGEDLKVAVEDVVKKQADVGIDVIDDGEFGKSSWIAYLADRFDGFRRVSLPREVLEAPSPVYGDFKRFAGFYRIYGQIESKLWLPDAPSKSQYDGNQTSEYAKAACVGPLRYKPEALQRDIANFQAALKNVQVEEAFLPVVAPASVEVILNKYYKTAEEYLFAVADALSTEYRMIVEAGFLLQIDDAMLPMMRFMAFGGRSVDEFHRWARKCALMH